MREQISVDKAIKRGHLIVNVPVFIAIIGCPALALYLSEQNLIPGWGIGIAFLIGFVLAWLIWSFMITKWRVWAFENVRNVHELKKRAIQEKLIWNDGNIFEKTEIRNTDDKRKLKDLEKKFEQEDEYREDYSLPPKIEIHFSKAYIYFELGISVLIIGVGIYLFTIGEKKQYILGAIMAVIGIYSTIKQYRKAFNNKPQIIIDSKGIQTKNVEFRDWSNIELEEVVQEGYGKSSKSYLIYFYDEEEFEKIEIDSLNVTHRELENILRTYRIRHNKNYS
ncbi:hypothetical protein DMB65_08325 [Flavobacterium cheongpyeongense]|jgi:hypothetical protein|uniref:Uncharacterized protein n=1 Tax=Flavobacterium cheongpyeongense TaxID=2212651 RepID=A0A2V4BRZ9_9FLAO|nr:hypothetical protein [Flavobacterium cheongpyeongense]PXY41397.1 hypothetical protein DMB65_08325 [Flavobacterium cheongpyeongense]